MFGQKIREYREKRGITQRDLAAKTKIPRNVISEYESNKAEIPAYRLIAIARALDVSIYELTGYEKAPDLIEIQRQIKKLPLDKLIEAARDKLSEGGGIPEEAIERAMRFLELLHTKKLKPWQIESITAILAGTDKGEKE